MSYNDYKNSESRTRLNYLKIKMDYCGNTFGVLPCTATGTKCYNTFFTCYDQSNFTKTTKDYAFINSDVTTSIASSYFPARPFLKNINDLPTEIKETDTITKRLKVTLADEPDEDYGIDPYLSTRSTKQGTYWKKWLARNPNYKGRIVELYEGYNGLDVADFEMKFAGVIESITYENYSVTIECTDLLSKLSDVKYPLKSDYRVEHSISKTHQCRSDNEMTALNARKDDFAERQDFSTMSNFTATEGVDPNGELLEGYYYFKIFAYDSVDRVTARASATGHVTSQGNMIDLSWASYPGASYYAIYKSSDEETWILHSQDPVHPGKILDLDGIYEDYPKDAERIYQLTDDDPTVLSNWSAYTTGMQISLDSAVTNFDSKGYIKVDKEILYYNGYAIIAGKTILDKVKRGQFETESDWHDQYTIIYSLLSEDFQNPYTILKSLLNKGGITSTYIDAKFTTYESAYSGILFNTNVIVKETKLNKIYFDLVNALDCMSWVGEDGKIKILKHSERESSYTKITDEANIIANSGKVNLNEDARYSRFYMYWNRFDVEKGLDDAEAYNRLNVVVDADAETSNEYNEVINNITYTTWLNLGYNSETELKSYIEGVLSSREDRSSNAMKIYECELENKDNDIVTGQLIELSTNDIQDINGNDYEDVLFRVIKKTPKGNKFAVKLLKTISSDFSVSISQAPQNPITEGNLVTYTCTTDAGSPTYTWYKNGSVVGSNLSTYSFTTALSDDEAAIKCKVSDGTIEKETITLTLEVNAAALSVSISQSPPNPVAENDTVTYTCTTNASSPTYQWYEDANPVGTNSDTYAFTATTAKDGVSIYCNVNDGTANKDSNLLILSVASTSSNTYYVSSSGSDSNTGLSTSLPWKTLGKIQTEITAGTFSPGDFILLKRGDTWNEAFTINGLHGNTTDYITIGAYGTGNLPEITCVADLPGWDTPGNWTNTSGYLWDMDYTSPGDKIRRLWIDGIEEGQAYWYDRIFVMQPTSSNYQTDFSSAPGHDQWSNVPNPTFKWTGEPSETHIQVYSLNGNPATNFLSMQFYTSRADMISIQDSSYFYLENIKTTGGRYASVIIRGGHDAEIRNMDLCDRASASGVVVRTDSGVDAYNVKVHNNTIDTRYTRYDPYRYTNTQFGVEFDYGAHDCEVYENNIYNIVEAAFRVLALSSVSSTPPHDITFRDNYVNGSGQRYAVAANMHAAGSGSPSQDPTPYNIYIYRNKFFWTTKHFQLGIKDSYVHHNIFYNNWGQSADSRVFHHFESCSGSGLDNVGTSGECYGQWELIDVLSKPCNLLSEGESTGQTTHYFNNTHYNIGDASIYQDSDYTSNFMSNNLFINTNRVLSSSSPSNWRWVLNIRDIGNGHIIKNNCFAPQLSSYNDEFVAYGKSNPPNGYGYPDYIMTVAQFNVKNDGDTISGNYLSTESLAVLINESDFSIPTESSAFDAGVSISSYMHGLTNFTDINGNTIDTTTPNLGAIDNSS